MLSLVKLSFTALDLSQNQQFTFPMSLGMKAALKMIAQNAKNPKLRVIDVRTPEQRAAMFIPNSQHIPLNELQTSLSKFSPEDTYLIYCRSGVRSLKASNFLSTKGIKAINMEGGINEYQKIVSGKEDAPKPEKGTSWGCNIY